MKKLVIPFLTFYSTCIFAQVQIDKQLQMTGAGNNSRVTGIDSVQGPTDAVNAKTIQKGTLVYSPDNGTVNAYVATLSPAVTAYTVGMVVNFLAANTNTGTSTLNVNGLGAKSIKKQVSTNLSAGDILAGMMVFTIYDGTNFQLVTGGNSGGSSTSNMNFSFTSNKTSSTIGNGGTGGDNHLTDPVTLSVNYLSGSTASASLNISGVPSGVNFNLTPGGGFPSFTSALYFITTPSSPTGTFPLTITATVGTTTMTVSLNLIVNSAVPAKRMFVTSSVGNGNLSTWVGSGGVGGITGGDNICNYLAGAAGLSGSWGAWLSTSSVNASSRIPNAISWYRIDGGPLATSTTNLLSGTLTNDIGVAENGLVITTSTDYTVFTGTTDLGVWSNNGTTCADWTSNAPSIIVECGRALYNSGGWSGSLTRYCDGSDAFNGPGGNRLYCFEK